MRIRMLPTELVPTVLYSFIQPILSSHIGLDYLGCGLVTPHTRLLSHRYRGQLLIVCLGGF